MKTTTKIVFGTEYSFTETQKCVAEIISSKMAILKMSDIYGHEQHRRISVPDSAKFVAELNGAFDEHNKKVDESLAEIRRSSLAKIISYCQDEKTSNERMKFFNSSVQKHTYDIHIGDVMFRINESQLILFEQKGERYNAVEFPISVDEFKPIEDLFLNFKKNVRNLQE